jgi:hypothetical protein
VVHDVEHVVAIAVLDQDIADDVCLAVVDELKLMVPLDAEQLHESLAHRGKGELDVVIAQRDRESVPPGEQAPEGCKERLIALDDCLQLAGRHFRIPDKGLPPG